MHDSLIFDGIYQSHGSYGGIVIFDCETCFSHRALLLLIFFMMLKIHGRKGWQKSLKKTHPSSVWTNGVQQVQQSDNFWFPTSLPRSHIFKAANGPGIGEFRGNTSTMTDKRYQICWFQPWIFFLGWSLGSGFL